MAIKAVFLCLATMLVMGCISTTEPYSQNFRNTPVGTKFVVINNYRLEEPVTGFSLSGEWDTDEIMRLAREAGITDLHYIDIKTLSILLGIFRRQTLIVYGD